MKKVTNKVIEVEEHRPKQLDLFQEPETEMDMGESVEDLPFQDAMMLPPLDNSPRIKRVPAGAVIAPNGLPYASD